MSDISAPGGQAAGLAPSGTFVREATGLVRSMGAWDALALAMGAIAVGGGFVAFFYMLGIFPRANLFATFLLGLIAALLLGLVYVQLVQSMPRTGGDYVFVSRLVHPAIGAAVGGAEFLAFATFPAFWSVNFSGTHFAAALDAFGEMVGWNGLSHFATHHLGGKNTSFIIALIFLAVLTAIVMYSTRWGARVLSWAFVLGIAVLVVGLIVLAAHSNRDFRHVFDAKYGAGKYQAVLDAGTKVGYTGGYSVGDTFAALPYAVLLIWGFSWAAYPGGELRSVSRTIKWSVIGSTLIAIAFYLVATVLANHVLGTRFEGAANFLATKHGDQYPISDGPSMTLYTSMVTGNGFLKFCISLIPVITEIGIVTAYLMTTSRILFALSFDRLLPAELRALSRRGTPVTAIALVALSILVMISLAVYTSTLTVWSNGTLALALVYVAVSAAAVLLVHRFPRIWEAGPRTLAQRVAGVPLISIISVLSFAFSIFIVVLAITRPLGIGPLNWKSGVALIVAFTWGVVVYYGVRQWYRGRGLNLDSVLKEIPAE